MSGCCQGNCHPPKYVDTMISLGVTHTDIHTQNQKLLSTELAYETDLVVCVWVNVRVGRRSRGEYVCVCVCVLEIAKQRGINNSIASLVSYPADLVQSCPDCSYSDTHTQTDTDRITEEESQEERKKEPDTE